jgi:hypothetical protein
MDLELLSERELVMELDPLMGTKLARDLVLLSERELVRGLVELLGMKLAMEWVQLLEEMLAMEMDQVSVTELDHLLVMGLV